MKAAEAMAEQDDDDFMLREPPAAYLSKRLGRPVSASAMRRWAAEGRGSEFAMVLGKASYTRPNLDAWIKSLDAQRKRGGWRGGPKKD